MPNAKPTTGRRIRSAIVVLFYVAVAGIFALPIFICGGAAIFGVSIPWRPREVVSDPAGEFTRFTGLDWPSTASIISVDDDHGGWNGDGEFHLIFHADRATLDRWLAKSPPWEQAEWKPGPVPTKIGYHCAFGSSGVTSVTVDGGPSEYSGDPELERVLGSNQVFYAAKERCCESLRWHNGNLLLIDLASNRVWLSIWDF
jgi:hypothetical protein